MGEFREWKESSARWREGVEKKLDALKAFADTLPPERVVEIVDFLDTIRTPRQFIVWTIRALAIAAIGGIGTALVAFIKERIRFPW